jgi:ribosomal protein L16 Arg81 hydroxylase
VSTESVLAQLISPVTPEEFFESYWPNKHLVVHGDVSRLPSALRAAPLRDVRALSEHYEQPINVMRGRVTPRMTTLPSANAVHLYEMGLTIYFPDVSTCVAGASELTRALEHDLGVHQGVCTMAAFASPLGDGLAVHYDASDLISVQLQGTKTWHIGPVEEVAYPVGRQYSPGTIPNDNHYPQMRRGFPEARPDRLETVVLHPGSVLVLPRGTWHSTEAVDASLSVSFNIDEPPALDSILEQLKSVLIQDPDWRRPLYGAFGSPERQRSMLERTSHLLADLPDKVAQTSAHHVLLSMSSREQQLAQIHEGTYFQRNPGVIVVTARETSDTVLVSVRKRVDEATSLAEFNLAPNYMPIVEWVTSQSGSFSATQVFQQVPEMPREDVLEFLQALCASNLLSMLWYPLT